jgi:hypothetical protein
LGRGDRVFRSSTGEWWSVYVHVDARPGAVPEETLVFEAIGVVRRVRRFPPNWKGLSVAELEELSWEV